MTLFQWIMMGAGGTIIVSFLAGFFAGGYLASKDWQEYWDWYVSTLQEEEQS